MSARHRHDMHFFDSDSSGSISVNFSLGDPLCFLVSPSFSVTNHSNCSFLGLFHSACLYGISPLILLLSMIPSGLAIELIQHISSSDSSVHSDLSDFSLPVAVCFLLNYLDSVDPFSSRFTHG